MLVLQGVPALAWREAATYLGLTADQVAAVRRLQADQLRTPAQALLLPAQRQRLHELEQAFGRWPAVESAQSAGLLPDRLDAAPAGFPQEQVSSEVTWQRVPAPALPGCPATAATLRPGIEPARDTPVAPAPR